MPRARRATVLRLATALADGQVDLRPQADPVRARADLAALAGIGPWTLETIAMRALDDPDAFLVGDLGVVLAARALGLGEGRRLPAPGRAVGALPRVRRAAPVGRRRPRRQPPARRGDRMTSTQIRGTVRHAVVDSPSVPHAGGRDGRLAGLYMAGQRHLPAEDPSAHVTTRCCRRPGAAGRLLPR
jgi:hypothetical protein